MIRKALAIAIICLAVSGPAHARDLWGDTGVILTDEATPVLARVERMNPRSRAAFLSGGLRGTDLTFATDVLPQAPVPIPGGGQIITAPPIPDMIGPPVYTRETATDEPAVSEAIEEAPYGPVFAETPPDGPDISDVEIAPQTDEVVRDPDTGDTFVTAEAVGLGDATGPDISGVEIFLPEPLPEANVTESVETSPGPDLAADEFEMAGVQSPAPIIPPTAEPDTPSEPRPAPPQFNSAAYAGLFTGVGIAEGMRLQLDLNEAAMSGTFVDSRGQNFRVDGQLMNNEGRAQAVVISAGVPVGYMDMQLTNLGLTSLFVPLDDNLSPQTASARQYEFLRTLSPAARSAIEAERAAREASQGAIEPSRSGNTEQVPGVDEDGLREAFPGDEDRRN